MYHAFVSPCDEVAPLDTHADGGRKAYKRSIGLLWVSRGCLQMKQRTRAVVMTCYNKQQSTCVTGGTPAILDASASVGFSLSVWTDGAAAISRMASSAWRRACRELLERELLRLAQVVSRPARPLGRRPPDPGADQHARRLRQSTVLRGFLRNESTATSTMRRSSSLKDTTVAVVIEPSSSTTSPEHFV